MVLQKFKSLKAAREAMVEDLIAESVNKTHEIDSYDIAQNLSSYKSGLYRFKTWEEARKYDMELIIRKSCRDKAA